MSTGRKSGVAQGPPFQLLSKQKLSTVKQLPGPTKCVGDFCSFQIKDPDTLRLRNTSEIAAELLRPADYARVRKQLEQGRGRDLLSSQAGGADDEDAVEFSFDETERYIVMRKSIMEARHEQAQLGRAFQLGDTKSIVVDEDPMEPESRLMKDTESGSWRKNTRQLIVGYDDPPGSPPLSAASYYQECRVCPVCYKVYTSLNRARDLLKQRQRQSIDSADSLARATDEFEDAVREKADALSRAGQSRSLAQARVSSKYAPVLGKSRKKRKTKPRRRRQQQDQLSVATDETSAPSGPPVSPISSDQQYTDSLLTASDGLQRSVLRNLQAEERRGENISFASLDSYLHGSLPKHFKNAEESLKAALGEVERKARSKKKKPTKMRKQLIKFCGRVLIVDDDAPTREETGRILCGSDFLVTEAALASDALRSFRGEPFDVLLVGNSCGDLTGIEFAKLIRHGELNAEEGKERPRIPIVALSAEVEAENLRQYMEAGMDGCVSKPVNANAVVNTLCSAVPLHRKVVDARAVGRTSEIGQPHAMVSSRVQAVVTPASRVLSGSATSVGGVGGTRRPGSTGKLSALGSAGGMSGKTFKRGPAGLTASTMNTTSSTLRPETTEWTKKGKTRLALPIPDIDDVVSGVFQMDADTAIPYVVIGRPREDGAAPLFNFVIVHDMFDTCEAMQIFFRPIVSKYPGLRVLVWNYPGQAFTEWRRDATLNNEFQANCLHRLLLYLSEGEGIGAFPMTSPFYMVGFGNGASIAAATVSQFYYSALRGLVLVNGFGYVDTHLAGVMHDCLNVFSCCPPTRPDLPVYFFARFLFSKGYLTKVGAPLALNMYTAVHNPISLEGRIQLCRGFLAHKDMRQKLADLSFPIIVVAGTRDAFVKPSHVQTIIDGRGGELRSIHRVLKRRKYACVVWFRAGHEVLQEARKPLANLMEQLGSGFHERQDVCFTALTDTQTVKSGKEDLQPYGEHDHAFMAEGDVGHFEDRFVDNVMSSMQESRDQNKIAPLPGTGGRRHPSTGQVPPMSLTTGSKMSLPSAVDHDFPPELAVAPAPPEGRLLGYSSQKKRAKTRKKKGASDTAELEVLDPGMAGFSATGAGRKGQVPSDLPEVREYMRWRVQRNKRRYGQLQEAALNIQKCFRSFLARKLVRGMRQREAASCLQRVWRGYAVRVALKNQKFVNKAAANIQRVFRGMLGRRWYEILRIEDFSARNIQRVFRGHWSKRKVQIIKQYRNEAAVIIQTIYRSRLDRRRAFHERVRRNAAIAVQRIYRGHLGRRRYVMEKDKYLFSKSQSQGVEFGRQMLMEHKLHATRLQSEVSMLTKEKRVIEETVTKLLTEVAEFEEAVRHLEQEMQELAKIETESKGTLDQEAQVELREHKMRLDREFASMLTKIADRRGSLETLEKKLLTIERSRQQKEDELRDLERKLVVLLEEQQKELEQIRKRQEARGELGLELNDGIATSSGSRSVVPYEDSGGGGNSRYGPTPQQREQANAMISSTESMMKFGLLSMSMTFFSSMNMLRAMKQVGAINTVLADASQNKELADQIVRGTAGMTGQPIERYNRIVTPLDEFNPPKAQAMAGGRAVNVGQWSVDDVCDWLDSLSLPQYKRAFTDAAVDGGFLYDLNNEDLKNTLGIDHALHRKKIMNSIRKLKRRDMHSQQQTTAGPQYSRPPPTIVAIQDGRGGAPSPADGGPSSAPVPNALIGVAEEEEDEDGEAAGLGDELSALKVDECISWVRHGKIQKLREALRKLPEGRFDPSIVDAAYIDGFGTQYIKSVAQQPFHVNKADQYGNSLLTVAGQNGNLKAAQLLIVKGANPNHQNNQGQTALHFAMAYGFFEFGSWLADRDKGGASDTVMNKFGLGPYDGLSDE